MVRGAHDVLRSESHHPRPRLYSQGLASTGASRTRELRRADGDLDWVGEHSRFVVDVDADRPAIRTEPEHKADRWITDDSIREVVQLVRLLRVAMIADVKGGAAASATTSHDEVRQGFTDTLAPVAVKTRQYAENCSLPLGQLTFHQRIVPGHEFHANHGGPTDTEPGENSTQAEDSG